MKVHIDMTVDVDKVALETEYGEFMSRKDIIEMVRSAVLSAAQQPGIVFPEGIIIDAVDNLSATQS